MNTVNDSPRSLRFLEVRMTFAMLLTFFPCALLYPLGYPVRETITLGAWLCAFPSVAGLLSLSLLALARNDAYSYFAFNAFCVAVTLAIALTAAQRPQAARSLATRLYAFARICIFFSLALAIWQGLEAGPWQTLFPDMYAIGNGRGGGLRTEPSLLGGPLMLYLSMAILRQRSGDGDDRQRHNRLAREAWAVLLLSVMLTRSITVVAVAVCFVPALGVNLKRGIVWGGCSALVTGTVLRDRIEAAISMSGGSLVYLITTGVSSWRNIPDILIFANSRDYLLPGKPTETRETINTLAALWDSQYSWLANTYSTFSASASTIGLIGTAIAFALGMTLGLRRVSSGDLRVTWCLLYLAAWFLMPKYEVCGWLSLSILCLLGTTTRSLKVSLR